VGAGGSVIEYVSPTRSRITLGAWSSAGIAGLLATFDADLSGVEPEELRSACLVLAARYHRAVEEGPPSSSGSDGSEGSSGSEGASSLAPS